jgi:hypothetical protein
VVDAALAVSTRETRGLLIVDDDGPFRSRLSSEGWLKTPAPNPGEARPATAVESSTPQDGT